MAISVAATLGVIAACAVLLIELRRDAWAAADQAAGNVLEVLSREIARDIELYDLSLQAVVDGLRQPGVMSADPTLRNMILVDRAASARGLGTIAITDVRGDVILRSHEGPSQPPNLGDRDYFGVHRERDVGCLIGPPTVSRLSNERVLTLSRRLTGPDGSFQGVVVGAIKLRYLQELLDRVAVGRGTVTLIRTDGAVVTRSPARGEEAGRIYTAIDRMRETATGSFVTTSPVDGVVRQIDFRHIGALPFILIVATATQDIDAPWRDKALAIGLAVLILCSVTIGLSVVVCRELERRAAAEAAMPPRTLGSSDSR